MKYKLKETCGIIVRNPDVHPIIEIDNTHFEYMGEKPRSMLLSFLFHSIILIFTLCLIVAITYFVCTYIEPAYLIWLGVVLCLSVVYTEIASGIVDWIFDIINKYFTK